MFQGEDLVRMALSGVKDGLISGDQSRGDGSESLVDLARSIVSNTRCVRKYPSELGTVPNTSVTSTISPAGKGSVRGLVSGS